MIASKIWLLENAARYQCPICDYKTHNKALFERHLKSTRHFLMSEFAHQAPRDVKMLVASFLPFNKIYLCGSVAVDALNYDTPNWATWRFTRVAPVDLPFQSGVVQVRIAHRRRTPTSGLLYV